MKITTLTRKLSAALLAVGLLIPSAANAASLGTNLLANPGFEIVGAPATNGAYLDAPNSSWMDGTATDYAYAHSTGYANGTLAGGGLYFFNSNFASPVNDVNAPGLVSQLVDVSTGDTATAIAAGQAVFSMSGYFSSFGNDGDFGIMELEFRDVGGTAIGAPILLSDSDTTGWTFESTSGSVPAGTTTLYLSLYGQAFVGGPDGYIDNVSLSLTQVPEPGSLFLIGAGLAGAGVLVVRRNRSR